MSLHPRAKSTATFINQARARHGDNFDYSEVNYVNARTHVRITCLRHGPFDQLPDVHLKGSGCPRCRFEKSAVSRRIPWAVILNRFRRRHGARYDYRQAGYVDVSKKIWIVCRQHGPFSQRPYAHAAGRGCPVCRYLGNARKQRLKLDELLRRFREIHGDRFDYALVTQPKSVVEKIPIVCRKHGVFYQSASKHLCGRGCAACGESHGERKVAKALACLGLAFVREMRFESCRDRKPLPFDFWIPAEQTLIEYDGRQHFEPSKRFVLTTVQRHDSIKTEWAQRQGLRLLRIPFSCFSEIPDIIAAAFQRSESDNSWPDQQVRSKQAAPTSSWELRTPSSCAG